MLLCMLPGIQKKQFHAVPWTTFASRKIFQVECHLTFGLFYLVNSHTILLLQYLKPLSCCVNYFFKHLKILYTRTCRSLSLNFAFKTIKKNEIRFPTARKKSRRLNQTVAITPVFRKEEELTCLQRPEKLPKNCFFTKTCLLIFFESSI